MRIYSVGCSFTHGDELQDPLSDAWPMLLAKKLNAKIVNDAVSGGTNYRSVYQIIKNLKQNFDLYIIAWTSYSRFTFYKSENNFEINFTPYLENSLYGKEYFFREWGKILYSHWYNELYAFKLWLQQIIQIQSIFKDRKILMINTMENNLNLWDSTKDNFLENIKHLINFNAMTDSQIFDEFEEIQYYLTLIDKTIFFRWKDFYITELKKKFPIGQKGHLLKEGHCYMSELIYQHLCL